MDAYQFLQTIWPDDGYYCLAIPFVLPGTQKKIYKHKVFDFKGEAALVASKFASREDIFFCVHTLKEQRVWSDTKKNLKTGTVGAYETRVQTNMHAAKCFFMDLDVGASDTKYQSQRDAISHIREFCTKYKFPRPMLVNSGYGVHVYWLLDTPILSTEWKIHAKNFRLLAKNFGIKFDPSRITDEASVLRVVGTYSHKNTTSLRQVQLFSNAKSTNTGQFLSILQTAISTLSPLDIKPSNTTTLGYNLNVDYDGPVPSIRSLLSNCNQVKYLALNQETSSEPEWYVGINLVRFVQDGRNFVHKFSNKHPGYSYDETEAKIDQLEAKGIRPSSCSKVQEVCGIDRCNSCKFKDKVKSPIVAATRVEPAKPVELKGKIRVEVPTPRGFKRLATGWIVKIGKNAEGDTVDVPIHNNDLYPVKFIGNEDGEQQFRALWHAETPQKGSQEFSIDFRTLYDRKDLLTRLADYGVMLQPYNIPDVQEYMIAYIKSLQETAKHDVQYNHFGWTKDKTGFVLGEHLITDTAREEVCLIGNASSLEKSILSKSGTLNTQIDLFKFYSSKKYIKHQFAILSSLASPIFYATGQHGAVVHLAGESGASKSTAIYAGAALWGKPSTYVLNGTRKGSTANAVTQRIHTLCHLPTVVDEITHMSSQEAHDMAMSATQALGRTRLSRDGKEKSEYSGDRSSIVLTTANRSLHNLLAQENTAGTASSMRILEIACERLNIHSKSEADRFLQGIEENYGHIGEAFLSYVIAHRETVETRVRQVMEALDRELAIEASERFWSAVISAALVAGSIANKLGLLNYNTAELTAWAKKYIKSMRGQVTDEYTTPLQVITNFMEYNDANMLVINPARSGNISNVIKAPKGPLLIRYEHSARQMWILKAAFKDYCTKIGMTVKYALDKLREDGIVLDSDAKKVLGAGCSGYEKGQSRCILIDMSNKNINDVVDVEEVDNVSYLRR